MNDVDKRVARRDAIVVALAAAAWFACLSLRPAMTSELRYAEAAREMVELRDWVVPRLAYVPYFEKPILLYWLGALGQRIAGGSAVAARIPAILGGVALIVAAYAFGRAFGGRRQGLAAAGIAGASAFALTGSVLTTDVVLSGWLALAWYAFARHLRRDGARWLVAAWACLGFATLTKGPLALVLSGGGLATYALATRRFAELRRCRPILGVLAVVAMNAPWAWLVWQRDPRCVLFFYVRENVQAFVDSSVNHGAGPLSALWYYPLVLLAMFLPWSLPVIGAAAAEIVAVARAALARWRPHARFAADAAATAEDGARPERAFLASLAVFGLAFLGASASKLPLYALPLCVPLAVLGVDGIARAGDRAWLRRLAATQAALILVAVVTAAIVVAVLVARGANRVADYEPAWAGLAIAGLVLLALAMPLGLGACRRGEWRRGLVRVGAVGAVAMLALIAGGSRAQRDPDARRLAAIVAARGGGDDLVVLHTKCVQDFSIVGTLHRRLHYLGYLRELGMGHFVEATQPSRAVPPAPYDVNGDVLPESPWLMTDMTLAAAWRGPRRVWLFARPKLFATLRDAGLDVVEVGTADEAGLATNLPLR